MIVIDSSAECTNVAVFGEFNIADYREFEDLVNYKILFHGPVDLLFDLRGMADFTLDVALEDLKFARKHMHDFRRIAVVTDSQWLAWGTWLGNVFADADLRAFSDIEAAKDWLAALGGESTDTDPGKEA